MTTTGLEMLDHTVQLTHQWINELDAKLGWNDKHRTYRLLRAVLQATRDCLPLAESADFAAQLPTLLRGVYFEHWRPEEEYHGRMSLDRFLQRLNESFKNDPIDDMADVVTGVYRFLSQKVSPGEVEDIVHSLPTQIRPLWAAA